MAFATCNLGLSSLLDREPVQGAASLSCRSWEAALPDRVMESLDGATPCNGGPCTGSCTRRGDIVRTANQLITPLELQAKLCQMVGWLDCGFNALCESLARW